MDRFFDELLKKAVNLNPEELKQFSNEISKRLGPRAQWVLATQQKLSDLLKQGNYEEFKQLFDETFGPLLGPEKGRRLLKRWGLDPKTMRPRPETKRDKRRKRS